MLSNNQWSATFESNWLFGYDLHVKVWWMLISSRNISFMKFHWIQTLLFGQTWMGPIHIATYSDRHVMLMLKLYCYLFFYKKFHIKHTKQMLAQRKKKLCDLLMGCDIIWYAHLCMQNAWTGFNEVVLISSFVYFNAVYFFVPVQFAFDCFRFQHINVGKFEASWCSFSCSFSKCKWLRQMKSDKITQVSKASD